MESRGLTSKEASSRASIQRAAPRSPAKATTSASASKSHKKNPWKDVPPYLAFPGRRQYYATQQKLKKPKPPEPFPAGKLSAAVDAIWTDVRHGAHEYFEPDNARLTARARNMAQYLATIPGSYADVTQFQREAEWRIHCTFHTHLVRTYGPHVATDEERAMYNFFIHIEPRELIVMDRILAKASKDIGETVDILVTE